MLMSRRSAIDSELLVEAAGMYGYEQLQDVISPNGFVALAGDELRNWLSQVGYLDEWDEACRDAAGLFSYPVLIEELGERNVYRNKLFLAMAEPRPMVV